MRIVLTIAVMVAAIYLGPMAAVAMLATRKLAFGGTGLVDQLPAKTIAGRTALAVPVLYQATLPGKHLDRKLAAVFAGHLALEHFLDVRAEASVVLERLGAILNIDPGMPADEFIVRGFIGILEPTPAAHIINEDQGKPSIPFLDITEQLLQCVSAIEAQSAFALVGVSADDLDAAPRGILADGVLLVLRRILLMLGRHPHVLSSPYRTGRQGGCVFGRQLGHKIRPGLGNAAPTVFYVAYNIKRRLPYPMG
jgi:hypothetical protein